MRHKIIEILPSVARRVAMRRLLVPFRMLFSAGLLAYLIWRANPAAIWAVWQQIDWKLLGLALVLQFSGVALSAAKWGMLLRARGHTLPFRWLLGNYLAGQFANNFLPTTVGGDALRVTQLGRRIASYSQASASVFMERLTGFLALSVIACGALLFSLLVGTHFTTAPWVQLVTAIFSLLAIGAMVGSFVAPQLFAASVAWLPEKLRQPFQRVASALADYSPRGGFLAAILGLSLLFQLLWIALHVVCGQALGLEAPLLLYALMVPLTDILGLLPIFFNNVGVREAIFILYLGQVGVPQDQAVALALLVFSVRLIVSMLGGVVLIVGRADFTTRGAPAAQ
jgi:uncharacterized protein (TIRG00374 family)